VGKRPRQPKIPVTSRSRVNGDSRLVQPAPGFRVAICVPVSDQCSSYFAYDLARMMGFVAATSTAIVNQMVLFFHHGTLIAPQRRQLVQWSREVDVTHILWLDSDMRFPKDLLIQLLARKKDIIAAAYPSRRIPIKPTAFERYSEDGRKRDPHYVPEYSTDIVPVRAAGMGVMLTRLDVFDKIAEPWFTVEWDERHKGYEGEDVSFCRRAVEAGYEILIDHEMSNEIAHIGSLEYTMDSARAVREEQEEHAHS